MKAGKITLLLLIFLIMIVWGAGRALSAPVLIKLQLTGESDYQKANQLGISVYHKFPTEVDGSNLVIAEFEKSLLRSLDNTGLVYQIVDEEPWSEGYYLISESERTEKTELSDYGKVLVTDRNYYFMKISDEKARLLAEKGFYIAKVFRHSLPLEYQTRRIELPKSQPFSPSIDSLLSLISQDSLYAWDLRLQNFRTRYSYSDSIIKARDWLVSKFISFGIDSVWLHHYYYDSNQWNPVATVVGTVRPDKVLVVGGHYDSVVYGNGTNPYIWAPGADDNGTGTIANMEMARIIAQNPLPVTVMFVPFAQEEQGLIGSDYFATYLENLSTDLPLMLDFDMIAHNIGSHRAVKVYGDAGAMDYIDLMISMATTYTTLTASYAGQSSGSDHYSFYSHGYDAIFASEGDFFNYGWHKNCDIVDSLSFSYMKQVTRMCLATLITVARSIGFQIGDATSDGIIDIADVLYEINYLYKAGPAPSPLQSGDVTCDGQVSVDDVIFLINYLYKSGPPPPGSC
jgi:hypothetical protein